jgi:hypothetical protein
MVYQMNNPVIMNSRQFIKSSFRKLFAREKYLYTSKKSFYQKITPKVSISTYFQEHILIHVIVHWFENRQDEYYYNDCTAYSR